MAQNSGQVSVASGDVNVTDPSNASRTMLYNLHTGAWDKELLKLFRIPASLLPEVRTPLDLSRYLAEAPREGQRLVLSPSGPASLAGLASMAARVELLIGPEGGLDDFELEAAARAGFAPVRLGPRVLRTETAGIVALAVLQALWGDLQ